MKIANIVSNQKLPKWVEERTNIFKEEDYTTHQETTTPTLFIGWGLTKSIFNKEVSILNKKIKDNIYWTFSPTEKRGIYESDIKEFIKKSYLDLIKNISYYNIDPIIFNIKNTEDLIRKLENLSGCVGVISKNNIFIYKEEKIYGIDLELLDFIGFDGIYILERLKSILTITNENDVKKFKKDMEYIDIKYISYLIHLGNE